MNFLLTGGAVFRDGTFQNVDVAISKGRIVSVSPSLSQEGFSVIECQDQVIVPGFVDRSEERRVGKECRSRWSPYH